MMFYIILSLIGIILYNIYFQKKARPNLPPGPKPVPLLGNIRDLPPKGSLEYQHWLKFKDIYGPISSIAVLGQSLIILHDRQAVSYLLEKSSAKTSGRPDLHFARKLCGYGDLLTLEQYDTTFRQRRKLIHQNMGSRGTAARFRDIQDMESHRFLLRVLNDPANLIQHLKTEASAIILRITYGYSIEPHGADPLTLLIDRMMHGFSAAVTPFVWPVDIIHQLEYLPEWLPGMSFKRLAREWNSVTHTTIEAPYAFVRQQMAKGSHRMSYVSSLVEQQNYGDGDDDDAGDSDGANDTLSEDYEGTIKKTAAIMYGGGADTTVSAISSFVLAMVLFPTIQKKAQDEIDLVVGVDRLPQFQDRDHLPYVNALVMETLRWMPVGPMATPHVADEDINYGGFFIPKGSILCPAVWWFLHDPKTYSDPSSFDPGRYMEPRNEPDPTNDAFGYGRRICPGRFLAIENLFITISRLLAVFDIENAIDESGKKIYPKPEMTSGLISHPVEFPYSIKPRSDKHMDLIRCVEVEHPWEESDARHLQSHLTNIA
ncbi:cytochrome P450 [Camillea tinctor]|nr:cytochrome P450 [Camillea tinctor]